MAIIPRYLRRVGACVDFDPDTDTKRVGAIQVRVPWADVDKDAEFVPPIDMVDERRKAARAKELEDAEA